MQYKIRPHHGMCLAYFKGVGYSDAFVDNMIKIKDQLGKNPEVTLTLSADVICKSCPNDREGSCVTADKVSRYDQGVLNCCGLQEGAAIHWEEFSSVVRKEILDAGKRQQICGDCKWNELCQD